MIEHLVLAVLLQTSSLAPPAKAPAPIVQNSAQSGQMRTEWQMAEFEMLQLETETLRRDAPDAPVKALLTWVSIAQSAATVLSIMIGGWWVYSKFVRAQKRYPNMEFLADINPIGLQNGVIIVELIACIENKGNAQHKMNGLAFDLSALRAGDPIVSDQRWGGQINFPLEVCRGGVPARSH